MLIHTNTGYYFQCDVCNTRSDEYPTVEALREATHFGSSLYSEVPGWVNSRGQLQVTADEAVVWSDQFKYHKGILNLTQHVCPTCRGFFNLYDGQ